MTTPPAAADDPAEPAADVLAGSGSQESPSTLEGAQSLVRRAIRQLAEQGSLPRDRAEELLAQVPRHPSRFALSQWVFGTEPINEMFCQYPECFRKRREYSGRGKPPKHCELRDTRNPDAYAHTSMTSKRCREKLLAQAAGRAVAAKPEQDEEAESRPVSHARESVPTMLADLVQDTRAIMARLDQVTAQVKTMRDPEAHDIELETVRLDMQRQIDEEKGRALALGQRVRTLDASLSSLRARLEEAHDAANEADDRSARLREDRDREIAERQRIAEKAEKDVAEARFDAEKLVAAAQAAFDAERDQYRGQLRAEVEAATKARDEALAHAEIRDREAAEQIAAADQKAAAANQRAADADIERTEAKATVNDLRAELTAVRAAMDERERRHENAARERDEQHRTELAELRETAERLQARIDQLRDDRDEHDAKLRADHARALDEQHRADQAQLTQLLADRDKLHAAASALATETIDALKRQIAQLEERAQRAEAEADYLRSSADADNPRHGTPRGDAGPDLDAVGGSPHVASSQETATAEADPPGGKP